jgi:flagellar biosynthesis protein FlhB
VSDSDKTEEATPRRLRKAREEGDSGASSYAAQAVGFVVAIALVPAVVRATASGAAEGLRAAVREIGTTDVVVHLDVPRLAMAVVALCVPVLIAAGVAAGIVHLVQTGGVIASRRLGPKLERLDPVRGMKGLVSGTRLFAVGRSLVAAAVVCWLAWRGLREGIVDIASATRSPTSGAVHVDGLATVISEAAGALVWRAAFVGLALGVVDLLVTRRAWLRRLRMSKDEVRREHKESEGDPHVKAARRRAYEELLAQATVASVRTASVVVVNPTHLACALRYEEPQQGQEEDGAGGDRAPVVIAHGEGDLAARIVRAAHDYSVPVVRDVPLARALVELPLGQAIPESLYEAVAAVLLAVAQAWEVPGM